MSTTPDNKAHAFRSSLPHFALAHHIDMKMLTNDAAPHNPGDIFASVSCYQRTRTNTPALVSLQLNAHCGFTANFDAKPDTARALAAALLEAADIVDQFTAHQAEERELARYNAGPVNRIELNGGVVAFEPAEGGAA